MMLAGILQALRDLPEEVDPEVAARMGYLEWVMTLPEGCPEAAAAEVAEQRAAPLARNSRPVALFCGYLRQTRELSVPASAPTRRGGGGRRRH
ncbi:hypothetical protein [Pseudodonghicola flavimaris]|uniref:Uncharacterized protein n=1 Tax=Pseudodonghicola flavimaris TaxID=3050036 RepID=A0ABT7F067_9RHOB|nr:hypothetical protein [Pseudodonghicola flavimaris]MDK3017996.1 hypothetical protein [Pseudodonghicola flavimaris]